MNRRLAAAITGIVVFLAVWESLVRLLDIRPFVLRAPTDALGALWEFRGDFARAAWVTAQHAVIGLAVALVVGSAIGAGLAAVRFLEDAAQPVLVLVMVTPWFAYVTSIVLWLGAGTPPALFMVALVCLPAIVFAATHDFDYATRIATRVAFLRNGTFAEMAPGAGTLLERYRAALMGGAA